MGIIIWLSPFTFAKKYSLPKKLLFFFCFFLSVPLFISAQNPDSISVQIDSVKNLTITESTNRYNAAVQSILGRNIFLNSRNTPVTMVVKAKKAKSTDSIFYLLAGIILLLAIIKVFFDRYFTNLFRVFFNTSLRQNQFTDQLLQARLPSLFFNIFFIISGGIYVNFLLLQYNLINDQNKWVLIGLSILSIGIVYLIKFCTLKFTGWITGYKEVTDTYIFIVFLICKIIGILLIPFIVLMVFSDAVIAKSSGFISILIISFFLLLRYFKSYGLLQNQLKISRFHFFLYIIGVEIMPLLLIYKGLLFLLSKNL
jgi:Domain of unknown function (DUF4271)